MINVAYFDYFIRNTSSDIRKYFQNVYFIVIFIVFLCVFIDFCVVFIHHLCTNNLLKPYI